MQQPGKPAQGFTLIELVVVLVISLLGFAMFSANFSSANPSLKIQAAAQDIASALRYAQGESLLTRIPVAVVVNLDNNSYRIDNHPKIYTMPQQLDISVVVAKEEFADGEAAIRYFADGSSTGGKITLEWGDQLRRIDVNWITGEVSISDQAG